MELTESQIYEGLGLEQPQAQEEQTTQEPGQPGVQEEPTHQEPGQAQDQEAPDHQEDGETSWATEQRQAREGPEGEKPQGEMSLEQRRENAARRRRAETKAAINEAVEGERRKNEQAMTEFFQSAGLKNPVTGEPIQNMEQYNAWKRDFEDARLDKALKGGGLTRETLDAAIKNNPVVQQAAQLVERARAQEEQQQRADMEARVERELEQIRQWDPDIRTVADLVKMENAQEFCQLVKRGNSFVDAYKLANYDRITQRATDAARQQAAAAGRQQAQNLARSKDHLRSGTQQGAGSITVPRGELDLFRAFNPQASEADIQAYYNKYQGGK